MVLPKIEVTSPITLNLLNLSRRNPDDIAPGTPVTNITITKIPYGGSFLAASEPKAPSDDVGI